MTKLPSLDTLGLNAGILTESMPGEDRLVLWLPAGKADGCRLWERIASTPGTLRAAGSGLVAVDAVLVPVRQQAGGRLGQLWQRLWDSDSERTWTAPTGKVAEQNGDRQTDVILVWNEASAAALTESALRNLWQQATRVQLLGHNLALIVGAGTTSPTDPACGFALAEPPETPTPQPERLPPTTLPEEDPATTALAALEAARRSDDRRQEATALVDVGLVYLDAGGIPQALEAFQQALNLAVSVGDARVEGDACSGLGTIGLLTGQTREAVGLFQRERTAAQRGQDAAAEKVALAHLGIAYSALQSPQPALEAFEEALTLARQVGDRVHEAELLWHLAVLHAELGRTAEAMTRGQAAVDGYAALNMLEAKHLASHLDRFREAASPAPQGFTFGHSFAANARAATSSPATPSVLRMALSGLSAVARFTGAGFQVTSEETRRRRLDVCHACEHHTGLRCRLCGCFTNVKARFPAERCPLAKWPD